MELLRSSANPSVSDGLTLPNVSASIHSLPPEILSQILHLASIEPDDDELEQRTKILSNFQLVSKWFNEVATHLLWKEIYLHDDAKAFHLLRRVGLEKYHRVETLICESLGALEPVLEAMRGLKNFRLSTYANLDFKILCFPTLNDLHSLRLESVAFDRDPNHSAPILLPSLKRLEFVGYESNSPAPYSSFYTPSLTHLMISPTSDSMITTSVTEDCHLFLDRIGSHLLSLYIRFMSPSSSLFYSLTSLQTLNIDCYSSELVELVKGFPLGLPLETLQIADRAGGGSRMREPYLVEALGEIVELPGFESVRVLKLGCWSRDQIEETEGGREVLDELEGREGRVVVFGFKGMEGGRNSEWEE